MNKKKLYIIAGVILTLLLISSYFYGLLILQTGDRDFALPEEAEVVAVDIIPPANNKIILEKDKSGQWWVNKKRPANEFAVLNLTHILRYSAVRQPVPLASQEEINRNIEKNGILINVYIDTYLFDFFNVFGLFNIKRKYNSFFVGDNATETEGTYMRMAESKNPYIVYRPGFREGIAEVFEPRKHKWFDPVVVDLEAEQIRQVKLITNENPGESFLLKVDEDMGFLFSDIDNEPFTGSFEVDTQKVLRFLSSFKDLYYESLLTNEALKESEDFIFPEYAFRIVVNDRYNNRYGFKVYRRYREAGIMKPGELSPVYDPDRFYIEPDDGQRAVAQYYVFGRVLRPLSFFIKNEQPQ